MVDNKNYSTTNEQYVPSEDEMRHAYRLTRLLDHHKDVDAAFDRFMAHVKHDALVEAQKGMQPNPGAA